MLKKLVVRKTILKTILKVVTISFVIGMLFYVWFFIDLESVKSFDFTAFLSGANIIRNGSGNLLYNINIQKISLFNLVGKPTPIMFRNPPTLAVFYVPFTFLPFPFAYKMIATLLLIVAVISAVYVSRMFTMVSEDLVIFCMIFFIPGTLSILTGQFSYLLLVLWLLIIKYLKEGRDFMVGAITGFFYSKPQYLMFAPFLLLFAKNKKRYLLGLLLVVMGHILISGYLIGFNNIVSYIYFLKNTEIDVYGSDPYSQISFSALLFNTSLYLDILKGKEYVINAFFNLLTFVYYVKTYSKKSRTQLMFALPLLILIFSPHVWDYDLVLILPSFFYLLSFAKKRTLNFSVTTFVAIFLYFGWNIRFLGFSFFTPLILIIVAIYIVKYDKPQINYGF